MSNPADTIRETLETFRDCSDRPGMYDEADAALAALTELEQQLADATRKYEAMDSRYHDLWHQETDRADTAEARMTELEQQLAKAVEQAQFAGMPAWERLWNDKQAAEADRDRLQDKADAYDAARAVVKTEGNTRAFYVLRAEAAEAEAQTLRDALERLDAWVSRMPDAGFNSDDPRWGWWHERPQLETRAALATPEETT